MRRAQRPSRAPRSTPLSKIPTPVNDSILIIGVMPTAAKDEMFSSPMVWTDECVLPLAASGVYPKTRVWGSREKTLHCFSATAPPSVELHRGCENSSGKTTAGSALDANGNTLSDAAGRTYTWDFENRLTQVVVPGTGTVSFKYDPFGRRIYKSSTSGTSIFAYDGDNVLEETNASGVVAARYAQTENIDEPLAMLRGGITDYYQADGLGSVTSLSTAVGTLEQTYGYDSFGNTSRTGSLVNPFQYTGRESDPETGLYYYRARYYDPETGIFVSEDRNKDGVAGSVHVRGELTRQRHRPFRYPGVSKESELQARVGKEV
jgi:RHS repeat-associated protein